MTQSVTVYCTSPVGRRNGDYLKVLSNGVSCWLDAKHGSHFTSTLIERDGAEKIIAALRAIYPVESATHKAEPNAMWLGADAFQGEE